MRIATAENAAHAACALTIFSRHRSEVQARALRTNLVRLWRFAATVAPVAALEWWQSPSWIGTVLRRAIGDHEIRATWARIPGFQALVLLAPQSVIGLALARILSRPVVLSAWQQAHMAGSPGTLLAWWDEPGIRGQALRRSVPVEQVVKVWRVMRTGSPVEALRIWGAEGPLPRNLRRALPVSELIPLWRQVATDKPLLALYAYLKDADPPRELRRAAEPTEVARLWVRVAERDPSWALVALPRLPGTVRAGIQAADLEPLFRSECDEHRESAIRLLGIVGAGER